METFEVRKRNDFVGIVNIYGCHGKRMTDNTNSIKIYSMM